MATCPLTSVRSAQVLLCEKYESWTVCLGCPALSAFTFIDWPGADFHAFLSWARQVWAKEGQAVCAWVLDDEDNNTWATTCGNMYVFMEGGPVENDMRYCPYCGKRILVTQEEQDAAAVASDPSSS